MKRKRIGRKVMSLICALAMVGGMISAYSEEIALISSAPTVEATEETVTPEPVPEATHTPEPAETPTAEPTAETTPEPTASPTEEVVTEPTAEVTPEATIEPTATPEAELPLTVTLTSEQRYAFAGRDTLSFTSEVSGGIEPTTVEYEIRVGGETVYSHSGFEAQLSYMPQKFGVHTLTVTATDANGQSVSASCSVPVAVDERETSSDWERSVAAAELSGDYAEDIVAIARTQLGYTESERNFIIDEDGKTQGYTRYGAWYGASYDEWCAMFVSFCAYYAQIPQQHLPLSGNCAKWKQQLGDMYIDDEVNYEPEAGDLIFFHYNRTEKTESADEKNVPNHVGIVTGASDSSVYTIEGNSAKSVRERAYDLNDEHIVGYVSMAEIMLEANPELAQATIMAVSDTADLTIERNVAVSYDENDNASFSAIKVTVTDYASSTDKKRNEKNAGSIQICDADGNWTSVASIVKSSRINIKDGNFAFDLNGKVTPDEVLNNLFRVELTVANDKDLSAPYPHSETFYLTDSLPKAGFREWVLNSGNGYLNADGTFNGDMNALAEAYKKYSRLGLTVISEAATGQAGQTVSFQLRVKSDEAMLQDGVIEIIPLDETADEAIAFDACTGESEYGSVTVQNGHILLTLNRGTAAEEEALINLSVPLSYGVQIGAHALTIDAKYTDAGTVQKQTQSSGTITVTAATGWHAIALNGPSGAILPNENVTYAMSIRNFDDAEVTLNAVRAVLSGAELEITAMRLADGTEIAPDDVNVTIPAASDVVLQLRVNAPGEAMDAASVDFTITDTGNHEETVQGSITVIEPTLTIQPVVDYDPETKAVTVKIEAENAGAPAGSYLWQSLDAQDDYADWQTIADTQGVSELLLTGDNLAALEALGENSAGLKYRLTDVSSGKVAALSDTTVFENLPRLKAAVEVVAELAEHYGYTYAAFRELIDHLYYVEVAKDGNVPFSDADSLMLYLLNRYESDGIEGAAAAWEKYRYDLYDPNLWPTRYRTIQEGASDTFSDDVADDYDFGDQDMNWEKDDVNGQPFHNGTESKVVAAAETDSGYFDNLNKTASAVKNGDENSERRYTIDLTAEANGKVMVPAAIVFQIQTSWQMFDTDHANGINGVKGSPCNVTGMATLYDIKHAMIDFAEWLKENSDGSIMFAITDVEHKGSYTAISYPYFTNDSETLIDALEGWDIFGNCEHVHYKQTAYIDAMNALQLSGNFDGWTGVTEKGEVDLYRYAKKVAVVIGGSTENTSGADGYGPTLSPGNMDYLYTIRTNSGTGILSWLDNSSMTSLVTQYNGVAYKDIDTREKVFETLKDIVQNYQKKSIQDAIQNVVLSDVITDEFEYVSGSARIVTTVDGVESETSVNVTTSSETDADGKPVTRISYTPESINPGDTLHLRFDVVAKEDYIGSNNVYTNEGKATLSYTNSLLGNASYKLEFEQNPQVNVPIRYEIENGGEATIGVNESVDLWSLGETIVKEIGSDTDGIEDWSVRYDQINGNVTYRWMKNVGTDENPVYEPVSETSTPVHVTNGVPDGSGFASLNHTFTSDETGDFPFVLKTTFTPDKKSNTWSGANDGEVTALTQYGKVIVHVVKATDIHVLKVDAADSEKKLEGAIFTLSQHGEAMTFANLGNGSYTLSESGTTELITVADGQLNITGLPNGEYTLCEFKAPDGYATNVNSVTFTTENGAMTQASATDEHWMCDTDTLTITLENEVWTEPTPTPAPSFVPRPTPPAAGNETSITVRKTWSDEENKDGKRPVNIAVQLQMNGQSCGESVTLTEANADDSGDWVYTWKDLPFKDEAGTKIEYSVIEDEHGDGMQWYDARYGAVEVIEGIEAGTHWLEAEIQSGRYAMYSESINVLLNEFDKPDKNTATSAVITGYNVKYDKVYDSELKEPAASAQWEFIQVSGGYQIRNGNGKYLTVGSDKKPACASEPGSAVWTISNGKLSVTYPKDNKGNTETKYLKMEDKDGGKLSLDGNSDKAMTFVFYREIAIAGKNDTYLQRITNVYKNPNATTEVAVKKVWANNGAYLHVNDSVTVMLYQNGTPMPDDDGNPRTLTLNAANGWTDTFAELPCYRVIDESTADMEAYVYSVYETASPAGYEASGEGDASYIITDPETGEGHYEVTITNTLDTSGYEPKKPDTVAHKRIDYLGDGGANSDTDLTGDDDYRLYLDFTGASEPIDVLFVIDTTNSMTYAMGSEDSTPRQTVVSNLMNGTNGNMGYLDQVATMNPENNVAVMLFSGPGYGSSITGNKYPYESNKQNCQHIMLDWTSGGQRLGSNDYTNRNSGTYYDPAIMRAREMFSDSKVANNGHRKIMIFITDGEPNGYINESLCYENNETSSELKMKILQKMTDFRKDFPNIETYTIGVSGDIDGVKDLLTSMAGSSSRFFSAYNGEEMTKALEKVMDSLRPHDIAITDSLSAYVSLNTAQPDLKITRTNRSTGEVMTVWQGNTVDADGGIGSAVSGYEDIVRSVQYTPSQAEDSTGTITVKFDPELHADSQYTYTLSYNVKATSTAYQYTDVNAEYPFNGDADTDYGDNATSSDQPGLRSNKEAKVDYTASGKSWHDDYPHPVIQTAKKTTVIAAPEAFKTVNLNGAAPDSATFNFTIEAVDPEDAPMPVLNGEANQTASWVYDATQEMPETSGAATPFGEVTFDRIGTYRYRITEAPGETEGWVYDDAIYLWTVTVTRQADNSLKAEGVLTGDGETVDKAEFVNEYASDLLLTIVKSDSTDHGKRLSGATFSLYSDAECTEDSIVTVYSDTEKTQEMTHFTTAGENGEITVYGLKPGTYYLKESAAPGGYCLIEGVLTISVGTDGVTTNSDSQRIVIADGKVVVYDSPIYDIPSTGGQGTRMFGVTGLALMLMAAVLLIYRRRERGNGAS